MQLFAVVTAAWHSGADLHALADVQCSLKQAEKRALFRSSVAQMTKKSGACNKWCSSSHPGQGSLRPHNSTNIPESQRAAEAFLEPEEGIICCEGLDFSNGFR